MRRGNRSLESRNVLSLRAVGTGGIDGNIIKSYRKIILRANGFSGFYIASMELCFLYAPNCAVIFHQTSLDGDLSRMGGNGENFHAFLKHPAGLPLRLHVRPAYPVLSAHAT